jgi:hypothetical protein
MVHQETLDESRRETPAEVLAHKSSEIVAQLGSMGDLQFRLLIADLAELWTASKTALVVYVVALIVFAAAVPVALAGAGLGLASLLEISPAAGLLLAALAALLLVAGVIGLGVWQFRRRPPAMRRSRRELVENLQTLKQMLSNYSRTGPAE